MAIRNFLLLIFLIGFSYLCHGQSTPDSSVYVFLELSDGSVISGEKIGTDSVSITINEFTLGVVQIKRNEIVNETDLIPGNSFCLTYYNGQKYCGKIISSDSEITINSDVLGILSLWPEFITHAESIPAYSITSAKRWFENPHGNRYLFVPAAIPLRKGDGYYENVMIDLSTLTYGLTNHISVGGGFAIPFAYMGTIKIGGQITRGLYGGCGAVMAGTFLGTHLGVAALYGILTAGNTDYNISVSSGYGFSKLYDTYSDTVFHESKWSAGKNPLFTVSGMARVSNRFSIISENWIFPMRTSYFHLSNEPVHSYYTYTYSYHGAFSIGVRTMWPKNSFDLAMVVLTGERIRIDNPNGLFLPYVDYVYRF